MLEGRFSVSVSSVELLQATSVNILLMSCYDYTYYTIMRVWKQPISRPGCTLYGWCAPNGPPGCTGEAQYISLAPSSPACLRFQTRFYLFFSVARTAEWQSPCCKDHLVREKGGFNLPECYCRSDGGIPSAVWKLFCFQTSFPPFWRHLLSLKNVSHRKKKKKWNDLTDDKLCKRTNTSFSRLHIWTNTLMMVV